MKYSGLHHKTFPYTKASVMKFSSVWGQFLEDIFHFFFILNFFSAF